MAAALIRVAKERGIATVLVGHVTKDGSIAGPRLLEHLVDVVLHFEGDRHSRLRLVRGVKNRYGPTDEVGCFDLHDEGIVGLADPSGLFLSQQRRAGARHLRHRDARGQAPAGRRGAGAGRRRRSSPRPRRTTSGPRRRPASRWCSPCCSGAAGVSARQAATSTPRPSAA